MKGKQGEEILLLMRELDSEIRVTPEMLRNVVVLSIYRGQHLGRRLMEYVIDYARRELGEVDLYLTSRPHRVSANRLYQSLGFRKKETNCYKMSSSDKSSSYL